MSRERESEREEEEEEKKEKKEKNTRIHIFLKKMRFCSYCCCSTVDIARHLRASVKSVVLLQIYQMVKGRI